MSIVHDFGSFLLCRPKLLKENVTIGGEEGIGFALTYKWLDSPSSIMQDIGQLVMP